MNATVLLPETGGVLRHLIGRAAEAIPPRKSDPDAKATALSRISKLPGGNDPESSAFERSEAYRAAAVELFHKHPELSRLACAAAVQIMLAGELEAELRAALEA